MIGRVAMKAASAILDGALTELCKVSARPLVRIPDGVGFAQAAPLPVANGTAHR